MSRPITSISAQRLRGMALSVGASVSNTADMIYNLGAPRFENCFWLWVMARRQRRKEWRAGQSHRRKERHKRYKQRPEVKERRRLREHSAARKAYQKEWRIKNRERLNAWYRKMDNTRRASDPAYRANRAVRARLHKRLKAAHLNKFWRTCELLGCTNQQLKAHLEEQFQPGMTWDNHGTVWHIDHIRALSLFNLADPNEQKRACHFTNLQPLFAKDNMQKQNKLVWVKRSHANSQALLPLPAH